MSALPENIRSKIDSWAKALGFDAIGVSDIALGDAEPRLQRWLAKRYHGDMRYMQRHGMKRSRPAELLPGTIRIISVRMDYLPEPQADAIAQLDHASKAYVSRYALGRDYHKLMRRRLQRLAEQLASEVGRFGYRAFVDSAPVMEKPIAEQAGLGWIGKHTNLIDKRNGSWFFLGELFTDLPLPVDTPANDHCGSCTACIDVCPTQAIVAPYQLDARRCISYLTIEHADDIPEQFRRAIGNRIYGCDDCQLFCPWNKFASRTREPDFAPRQALDNIPLTTLCYWTAEEWLERMQGTAIRRIGFRRWQRNLAVALGNAQHSDAIVAALQHLLEQGDAQVARHARWAIEEQRKRAAEAADT
ncbi:MAG: tRNA epoxyqueuosine(34) reductase QueG [Pseudomonadota bacterium]